MLREHGIRKAGLGKPGTNNSVSDLPESNLYAQIKSGVHLGVLFYRDYAPTPVL